MKFKSRREWREGRSIVAGRSSGGQIVLKGWGPRKGMDIFLVRIGKMASSQVVGYVKNATEELSRLQRELESGRYVSEKTYGEYQRIVRDRIVPVLGRHRLQRLDCEAHLQPWVDGLWEEGLAPKTVRLYTSQLTAALKRAVGLGILTQNPADELVTRPPGAVRPTEAWRSEGNAEEGQVDRSRVWSGPEVQAFVKKGNLADEMVRWVVVGIRTGLRPGEQSGLRWSDVDLDAGVLTVCGSVLEIDKERRTEKGRWEWGRGKTGKRTVVLCDDTVAVLRLQEAHVKELHAAGKLSDDRACFVFPARFGPRPFNNPSNVKDRLRDLIIGRKDRDSANGMNGIRYIPPYGLRHTHATDLLHHGWNIHAVAKRLGTSALMVDRRYGHLLENMQAERLDQMTELPGLRGRKTLGTLRDTNRGRKVA